MESKVLSDGLKPKGKVEIFTTKGKPDIRPGELLFERGGMKVYKDCDIDFADTTILDKATIENIIVNQGKDVVIKALVTGNLNQIGRMAIGDRGTLPADPATPKVPVSTFTTLYNEVYRDDVEATTLNIGTETVHEVKFIKVFNAVDIPISAFSNQTNPVINEVGLITYDAGEAPLPRSPVIAPDTPMEDEKLFSIRTFKSVPFEAVNEISVTIRYTIFIE